MFVLARTDRPRLIANYLPSRILAKLEDGAHQLTPGVGRRTVGGENAKSPRTAQTAGGRHRR